MSAAPLNDGTARASSGIQHSPVPSDDGAQSRIALAARDALRAARERSSEKQKAQYVPPTADEGARGRKVMGFSFLAGVAGGLLATALSTFVAMNAGWIQFDRRAAESLDSSSENIARIMNTSDMSALSSDELKLHRQLIDLKMHGNGVHQKENGVGATTQMVRMVTASLHPLLPFTPIDRSGDQEAKLQAFFRQYAELVRQRGPDGRKLDEPTVELNTERLVAMMAIPGTIESSRAEAAHDLAEKCKLLYLMQLRNTRSANPEQQAEGRRILLDAADGGLRRLFVEFATGDMTFSEIFRNADDEVKPELLLIRYWYYRAASCQLQTSGWNECWNSVTAII